MLKAWCPGSIYMSISFQVILQYVTTTGVITAVDSAASMATRAAGPLLSSRRMDVIAAVKGVEGVTTMSLRSPRGERQDDSYAERSLGMFTTVRF